MFVEILIDRFEISCEEITRIIGIKPDDCRGIGTKYISNLDKKEHISKTSYWRLDSGIGPEKELEDIFKGLLNKLRPYKKRIIPICKKYSAYFNIIIHIYGNFYPAIDWDKDILKEIAEYNASMGIDLSVFSEEELENFV